MTTQTSPSPDVAARHAVHLDHDLRQIRADVARWALASGRPLNLDAITVILAAKRFEAGLDGRPFHHWTASGVLTFLLGSASEWCRQRGVARPPSFGESLFTYVDWLGQSGQLDRGSSEPAELLAAVVDIGGLTRQGRAPLRSPGRPEAGVVAPRPLVRRRAARPTTARF